MDSSSKRAVLITIKWVGDKWIPQPCFLPTLYDITIATAVL